MRKFSFILTILGISVLLLLLFALPPTKISSPSQINSYISNQKFLIESEVIKETYSQNSKTLHLKNNLSLSCTLPCPALLNKKISAIVKLERYNNKNYLKILELSYN